MDTILSGVFPKNQKRLEHISSISQVNIQSSGKIAADGELKPPINKTNNNFRAAWNLSLSNTTDFIRILFISKLVY